MYFIIYILQKQIFVVLSEVNINAARSLQTETQNESRRHSDKVEGCYNLPEVTNWNTWLKARKWFVFTS
jgi:hypothetical protein